MVKHFAQLLLCSLACSLFAADSTNPPPDERFKVDLLVVVAHPDDETEIGAYLARAIFDDKKRVAVVFGTRGNSGGNAEGQEQAGALGSVREIEARQALGHFNVSEVWFLNGTDTPGQDVLDSLETWDHGDSLGRLVRLVRLTRPYVIATWLPDWVAGENHGDHQAAGVLATEAFDSAGDPTVFAEQLATPRNREDIRNLTEGLRPWQPEKLYYFSDTAHTEVLKGKGPAYASTEQSPARGVTYAKLAAEECSYHLTQSDTGQAARQALAKNDLSFFNQPVLFVHGKSFVNSIATADLFAGVEPGGVEYHRPPGFTSQNDETVRLELGGPFAFYRYFWQAHGIDGLAQLVGPEMMAKYGSAIVIPVLLQNPTAQEVKADFSVKLPEGWTVRRSLPASVSIGPHRSLSLPMELKTSTAGGAGWRIVTISAKADGKDLGSIKMRVELNSGAMPQ